MRNSAAQLGVRHRTIRNALRSKAQAQNDSDAFPSELKSGEMQLHSYFLPGLQTGNYKISANQTVEDNTQSRLDLKADGSFDVPGSKWAALNPGMVHSTFPPPGIPTQNHILPHIVFNDPQLPWERSVDTNVPRVPWLAVISFEQDEVIPVSGDYSGPFRQGSGGQGGETVKYILIKKDLFLSLFTSDRAPNSIDLSRYAYLAHSREVNVEHMTDARNNGGLDTGTFSVVLSHRTGPFISEGGPKKPCVVHVVALDSVKMDFIHDMGAVVTLYSWTYDCLPPLTINFKDTMRAVGKNSGMFRAPQEIFGDLDPNSPIRKRIEAGYTLVRYRVQTGEETVALMRGPFVPFGNKEEWFKVKSNSGEDLQIIDTSLGMIDISYCTAWQIGKALAIADQAFSAALLRIRGYVHNASSAARKQRAIMNNHNDSRSDEVIGRLKTTLETITNVQWKTAPEAKRYSRAPLVQTRYLHILNPQFKIDRKNDIKQLGRHLGGLTGSVTGSHFTELEDPKSTDWKLVLNWLMDKIYLEAIPSYYIISDPTWLPPESIRFFYVDTEWLSALVDGALSVCNHLDKDDATREAIKDELRYYIEHDLHPLVNYRPQLPRYGFYMRSVAVTTFPDLVIRAPLPQVDKRAEVLRQENVGKGILLCLFDRTPNGEGDKKLTEVKFSQPAHQQCFTFCDVALKEKDLKVNVRKVFSKMDAHDKMDVLASRTFTNPDNPPHKCPVYDWSSRTIDLNGFANLVKTTLQQGVGDDLYKGEANAALIGIQLNDPIYQLTFTADELAVSPSLPTRNSPPSPSHGSAVEPAVVSPPDVAEPAVSPSLGSSTNSDPLPVTPSHGSSPTSTTNPRPVSHDVSELRGDESSPSPSTNSDGLWDTWCSTVGVSNFDYRNCLWYDKNGTDIVFGLIRADKAGLVEDLPYGSGDHIKRITLALPLGLFRDTPPVMKGARMLRNMRIMRPIIKIKKNNVIVELVPKAHDGLTLVDHNEDLSFMIVGARLNLQVEAVEIRVTESYEMGGDVSSAFKVVALPSEQA